MAVPSFLFGGNTNLTYDELQQKRALQDRIAQQIAGKKPETALEGFAALAAGLGNSFARGRLEKTEKGKRKEADELFNSIIGGTSGAPPTAAQGMQASAATSGVNQEMKASAPVVPGDLKAGIAETASALGVSPVDLATAISYETAGTFDPSKRGPRTQWGQHQGLIQFGEPQAQKYGVDWENPVGSQLGPDGAVAKYLRDTGVKPGMGLMDIYSAINAGGVGRYGASDANNGGAPGTVADKVNKQMAGHRAKALALFGDNGNPGNPQSDAEYGARLGTPFSPQSATDAIQQAAPMNSNEEPLSALPVREIAPTPQVAQVQDRQQAPPNTPSQQNGVDPRLYQALANPWLNDGQKASIQAVIQQQQQAADRQANEQTWRQRNEYEQQQRQNDPAYQLNLKRTQVEIDQAMKPGYRVLQQEERTAFGIPPDDTRPYQVSREGQISAIGGMGQAQTPGVEARQREALAQQYGIDPQSAEGQRFILTGTLPTSDRGVTAGDREAIRDADEMVNSGQATLSLLDRAMDLSGKAYEGVGAGTRALIGSQFGDEGALATREYDNIVTEQALGQLKAIFGGAPTEGERAILLEIQGSSSQPKSVRDNILKRARAAVERRVKFNQDRATELRGGTYYKPRENGQPQTQQATPQTAPQGAPNVDDLLKKYGQ